MNKAFCRGCGAPIVWIRTPGGKSMPCDPSPVYYNAISDGRDRIVTVKGEVVSGMVVNGTDAAHMGYQPHWAACPQAGRFRKREQSAGDIKLWGKGEAVKEVYEQIDMFDLLKEERQDNVVITGMGSFAGKRTQKYELTGK